MNLIYKMKVSSNYFIDPLIASFWQIHISYISLKKCFSDHFIYTVCACLKIAYAYILHVQCIEHYASFILQCLIKFIIF